jgi:hypothetical protein
LYLHVHITTVHELSYLLLNRSIYNNQISFFYWQKKKKVLLCFFCIAAYLNFSQLFLWSRWDMLKLADQRIHLHSPVKVINNIDCGSWLLSSHFVYSQLLSCWLAISKIKIRQRYGGTTFVITVLFSVCLSYCGYLPSMQIYS